MDLSNFVAFYMNDCLPPQGDLEYLLEQRLDDRLSININKLQDNDFEENVVASLINT